MTKPHFEFEMLRQEDYDTVVHYLGQERNPDLVIAPDGHPYLYRWHVVPRTYDKGNVYLHVQVHDDPDRPLHDHPWDNVSVILAGGYQETVALHPSTEHVSIHQRKPGDVIFRPAHQAHHLQLSPGELYSISLFTTGPKCREWGFWTKDGWRPANDLVYNTPDGRSLYIGPHRGG